MGISLREYQKTGMHQINAAFATGYRRVLAAAPPGAGKGTIMGSINHRAYQKGTRTLNFAHKRELCYQLKERYEDQFNMTDIGFILSGEPQRERQIMIGSTQTIHPRIKKGKIGRFDFVIMDECHRFPNKTSKAVLDYLSDGLLLGFTATPFRTDKKPFKLRFDKLVQMTTYSGLVADKFLVPTRVVAPMCPSLDGIKVRAGDYATDDLYKAYDEERIYESVVDKWLEYGSQRKTIGFSVNSTLHLHKICKYFQKRGIDARYISDNKITENPNGTYGEEKMKRTERKALYEAFERGDYPILWNINLFTEGISIDDVSCIVFNVATKSKTKYVQAGARGSRPLWNRDYTDWRRDFSGGYEKEDCLIIDFGGNCERHGFIDHYDLEGFTLEAPRKKKAPPAAVKACPKCQEVVLVQVRQCKCGYKFPIKQKDKAYADELDWEEQNPTDSIMAKMAAMSYSSIYHAPLSSLRLIVLAKGKSVGWAYRIAIERGEIEAENPSDPTPADYREVKKIMEYAEKQDGLLSIYRKLMNKYKTV